jgi:hypothetical protein
VLIARGRAPDLLGPFLRKRLGKQWQRHQVRRGTVLSADDTSEMGRRLFWLCLGWLIAGGAWLLTE